MTCGAPSERDDEKFFWPDYSLRVYAWDSADAFADFWSLAERKRHRDSAEPGRCGAVRCVVRDALVSELWRVQLLFGSATLWQARLRAGALRQLGEHAAALEELVVAAGLDDSPVVEHQ